MTGHAIEARVYAEDPGARLPADRRRRCSTSPSPPGHGVRVDSGLARRHGRRQRLRPDAGQGHRARRRPRRRRCARSTARSPTPRCSASPPTSGSCASCSPIPTSSPAASTPGCSTAGPPTTLPAQPGDDELIAAAAYKWLRGWPGTGRRPVGGAVGLADRASGRRRRSGCMRASAPTTCTSPAHRRRRPRGRGRRITHAHSISRRRSADRHARRSAHRVPRGRIGRRRSGCRGGGRTAMVEEVREAPRPARRRTHAATPELDQPDARIGGRRRRGRTAQRVDAGAVVVTVEAMKMEHALSAPVDGVVELLVAVGDQVKVGQPLATDHRNRHERKTKLMTDFLATGHAARSLRTARARRCATSPKASSRPSRPSTTTSTRSPTRSSSGMGEMGLFGLPFPEEYGGMGGDYFALCLALEELGKVDQCVAITLEAGRVAGRDAGVPLRQRGAEAGVAAAAWPAARRSARSG